MKANLLSRSSAFPGWLLIVLSLVLILPIAIACGDDDDDDETPTTGAGDGTATTGTGGSPTAGGGDGPAPGEVDILGIWGADELESFEAMAAPYEERGGTVNFTGTRNITADLTLRVEGGNPPDIAIPAEIGLFNRFASEGLLSPLSACEGLEELVRDKYPQGFIDLATVDGELYGFFMKADTKGTIWYNPTVFEENDVEPLDADASFDDLVELTNTLREAGITPWSMGVESAEASGWPGTDWLQQIILNEAGEEVYDGLIDGSIPFTDDRVKAAWESWGELALGDGNTVQGGGTGINATNFQDATYPPFQDPPQAAMTYLGGFAGGFITTQFPNAAAGEDYDFFTFPGGGITGSANIVYAFNAEPATCSFLLHLASGETQQIWVERGGFTSVNSDVSLDAYPDDVARKQAEQLLDAELFRFDLDDAIGGALQSAYFQGVTEFLDNPNNLDQILAGIEATRGQQ